MNTKIITALVIAIALVGLTGSAAAINPYVNGGGHYAYGDSTSLTLVEDAWSAVYGVNSGTSFITYAPGCPMAIVGSIDNLATMIGAKGAVDDQTTPLAGIQSGWMDVTLNDPIYGPDGTFLGTQDFAFEGEMTQAASIGANTPDHGASKRHTYGFLSNAQVWANCQPGSPITAYDTGKLIVGMGCVGCENDLVDESSASVTFDYAAAVDLDTSQTSMLQSSIDLNLNAIGELDDEMEPGCMRIDVWELWQEIGLQVTP